MDISQVAKQFDVDEQALKSMMDFLARKACENPDLFERDPRLFIEMGMRAYNKAFVEFCSEMAYGKSQKAANMRSKMAAEVYYTIKETV